MGRAYKAKRIFLALSIGVGFISAIGVFFIPQKVAEIFYHDASIWMIIVPKSAHLMYGIGFLFITVALLVIALLNLKKQSFILGAGLVLLSIIPFYLGSQGYIIFSHESISFSYPLSTDKYEYGWQDLKEINYFEPTGNERGQYVFTFHDQNELSLEDNLYFSDLIAPLFAKLDSINLKIERAAN